MIFIALIFISAIFFSCQDDAIAYVPKGYYNYGYSITRDDTLRIDANMCEFLPDKTECFDIQWGSIYGGFQVEKSQTPTLVFKINEDIFDNGDKNYNPVYYIRYTAYQDGLEVFTKIHQVFPNQEIQLFN